MRCGGTLAVPWNVGCLTGSKIYLERLPWNSRYVHEGTSEALCGTRVLPLEFLHIRTIPRRAIDQNLDHP